MSDVPAQIVAKVKELVAAKPEFVYEPPPSTAGGCINVYEGKGSCLIGQALFDLGIIDAQMEVTDDNNAGIRTLVGRFELGDPYGDEVDWLADVQFYQDRSHPWATAVDYADKAAAGRRLQEEATNV